MNFFKSKIKAVLIKLMKRMGETSSIVIDFNSIDDGAAASELMNTMRLGKFLEPQEVQAPANKSVLIIAPHPDDEVIGMGGTLHQMIQNGCAVHVLYLTLGLNNIMREEAQKSSNFLGYTTTFFDYADKEIPCTQDSFSKLVEVLEAHKPDIVFLPFMLDDHDDHRRASQLLLNAFDANMLRLHPKTEVWAYQVYTALPLNAVVNITSAIDQKTKAIQCYSSRFKQRDWAHYAKGLNASNVRYLHRNTKQDYAEVFMNLPLERYIDLCRSYFEGPARTCYITTFYNETLQKSS